VFAADDDGLVELAQTDALRKPIPARPRGA
jgi:hypothetical protein